MLLAVAEAWAEVADAVTKVVAVAELELWVLEGADEGDTDDEEGEKNLPLQRYKNFVVIDDMALQSTKDAPKPENSHATAREKLAPYVKVVAAQHQDGTRLPPTTSARSGRNVDEGKLFPGYLKVPIIDLRFLWEESFTYDLLDLCPNNFTDEPDWSKRYDLF